MASTGPYGLTAKQRRRRPRQCWPRWRSSLRYASPHSCEFNADRQRRIAHPPSLDHLVGAGEERGRHGEAEGLRGLEIDHELEARRLFDWQIARIGALQNFVHVRSGAPKYLRIARPVGDETSHVGEFSKAEYRGHAVLQCEIRELFSMKDHERIGENNQCLRTVE